MKATITSSAATQTKFPRDRGGDITFPKQARILRRSEFRLVYDHGIRFPGPLFAAFCLAQPAPQAGAKRALPPGPQTSSQHAPQPVAPPAPARVSGRLGLTVPRAVGGSVERNRIRRRLREAFRMHRTALDPRWDIVLNPRRASLAAPFPEIERAVIKVIERCNSR